MIGLQLQESLQFGIVQRSANQYRNQFSEIDLTSKRGFVELSNDGVLLVIKINGHNSKARDPKNLRDNQAEMGIESQQNQCHLMDKYILAEIYIKIYMLYDRPVFLSAVSTRKISKKQVNPPAMRIETRNHYHLERGFQLRQKQPAERAAEHASRALHE